MGSLSSDNISKKCLHGGVGFKKVVIRGGWEIFFGIFLHLLEFHNCISHNEYQFSIFVDIFLFLSHHKVLDGLSSTRGQLH